jgi:ankyrin repeat protein
MGEDNDYDEILEELEREKARAKADPRVKQLVAAAGKGDVARVAELLAAGADPNLRDPFTDGLDTPVSAATFARKPEVIRALARAGADLNAAHPYTPLTLAAEWGHIELARALIESGADVNHPDSMGCTPLNQAVRKRAVDVIGALLNAGADPTFVPARAHERGNHGSPLDYAVQDKELLDVFLSHGADARSIGPLLLWGAAARGDAAEVKRLLDGGADLNAPNAHGQTSLAGAALMGHAKVVTLLIARGADVSGARGRRDAADSREDTPLVAAVCSGKLAVVKAIIEAGGTEALELALDYAKDARLKKITEYLLEVKAKLAGTTRSAKSKPSKTKAPRTGVPTFDLNEACLLVDGAVEAVAGAFKQHVGAKTWEQDVLGRAVTLSEASFAVFRLAGQPWSIIMQLSGINPYEHLKTATAQALSKSLKTRAMLISFGDASGIYKYVTFHDGEVVEIFDTGSVANDMNRESIVAQFRKWYDVDLDAFPNVQIAPGCVFASTLRTLKLAAVKNALTFIADHLAAENAFAPFYGDATGARGQRYELTLEGFGPDDIERLDYVADGAATGKRKRP